MRPADHERRPSFRAIIRLLTPDEGGLRVPPRSGGMPAIAIGGVLHSARLDAPSAPSIPLGEEIECVVTLITDPPGARHTLRPGARFPIQKGARRLGEGVVLAWLPDDP